MAESSFKSNSKYLLVAAFDFGTTYSGYAFSFRDSPLKIQTNQGWNAGSEKLISLKTPTCILLKPNKEFHSFGFEAENYYANLALDDKHHGWYLFRKFKMMLHNNKDISRRTSIEDINGQSMNAMTIFSMSIRYLKDHLLKCLDNQAVGITESDMQYVLTVPAIWNDGAKQFMRESAIKAGIQTDQLKIALEPEAASIWCQTITEEANLALSTIGNQYMVVDLGGGTADITVHELKPDATLKEIHKASGGPWGGTEVDNNYISMMTKLVGDDVMKKFKDEQMSDYFDMLREFEMKKRTITHTTEGKVTFRLFTSLKETFEEEEGKKFKQAVSESDHSSNITVSGDKLRVDAVIVQSWFESPIENLISHIKGILAKSEIKRVDCIVLVGGFGECQLVQESVKSHLKNKRLIIPNEAGLAVLKGAVKFGHLPYIVSERISKFTYGIRTKRPFNPSLHPESKKQILEDKQYCRDIFCKYISAGEVVPVDHTVVAEMSPSQNRTTGTNIYVFCTECPNPTYTTDSDCKLLGELSVDHPQGEAFNVTFIFGETELIVKTEVLKTGCQCQTSINCL